MSLASCLQSLYKSIRDRCSKINVFENLSSNPVRVRRQILSTRLFFVLFIASLYILVTYTAVALQTVTETIKQPDLAVFERVEKKYPNTLECPCAKISVPYGKFFQAVPFFHQVCTSDFISQLWIDHVFGTNASFIWSFDVRASLSSVWQIIAGLCGTATTSIVDALDELAADALVTSLALPEKSLRAKTQAAFDIAYRTAVFNLAKSVTIVHRLNQANGYLTGISRNFVAATGGSVLGGIQPLFSVDTKQHLSATEPFCLCQREMVRVPYLEDSTCSICGQQV